MQKKPGRPLMYESEDTPLKLVSVRLSTYHKMLAVRYGDGSVSKGIRAALEAFKPEKTKEHQ